MQAQFLEVGGDYFSIGRDLDSGCQTRSEDRFMKPSEIYLGSLCKKSVWVWIGEGREWSRLTKEDLKGDNGYWDPFLQNLNISA